MGNCCGGFTDVDEGKKFASNLQGVRLLVTAEGWVHTH